MDCNTGKIHEFASREDVPDGFVDATELMTNRQERREEVSKNDNRSALGKIFTAARKAKKKAAKKIADKTRKINRGK